MEYLKVVFFLTDKKTSKIQGFHIQLKYFLLLVDKILQFSLTLNVEIFNLPVKVSFKFKMKCEYIIR